MKTTILERQNLLDIALQEYGSPMAVFDLAMGNGMSITEKLEIGKDVNIPKSKHTDPDILSYYQRYQIHPVTDSSDDQISPDKEGIGIMSIQQNFIIR